MTTRDLKLDADGDIVLAGQDLALVSDADAVEQSLEIRCKFFVGEWFLDPDAGLPFFTDILIKNPNFGAIEALYRDRVLETLGIDTLESLLLVYEKRNLAISIKCTADTGELIQPVIELTV